MDNPLGSRPAQAVADVQRNHPNAVLSGGTGTAATAVVWTATTFGLPMDAVAGAAFATILSSAALFIGRRGLKGIFRSLWFGSNDD